MYEDKTYENIREDIINDIDYDIDKSEGSFTNNMISPIALEVSKAYSEFDKMLGIMFLEDSADVYIDKRCSEFGIYRKQGTKARGQIKITGANGTKILKGSLFATESGLIFESEIDSTIVSDCVIVDTIAYQIGTEYNVPINAIIQLPITITGVVSICNEVGFVGGTNIENDTELTLRCLEHLQLPSTSGNIYHYKEWAKSVNGVGDARVFPLANGNGTVSVLIVDSNKFVANAELITATSNYIESVRPIGASVTVSTPISVIINISATIVIKSTSTISDVQKEFESKVKNYIKESVFKSSYISYAIIGALLLDVVGVSDYSNLTLNNGTSNIMLEDTQVATFGGVMLNVN